MLVRWLKVINFHIQSQLVFSDVWGPSSESFGHVKYYVSFIDDYRKFTWIYLLKKKSDVFQKFCDFQNHVARLFDKKILAMQTDWRGEYKKLNSFSSMWVSPILSLVLMRISKMVLMSTSIDILLRLVSLSLPMRLCLLSIGMKLSSLMFI
jgi:hypothetical protein